MGGRLSPVGHQQSRFHLAELARPDGEPRSSLDDLAICQGGRAARRNFSPDSQVPPSGANGESARHWDPPSTRFPPTTADREFSHRLFSSPPRSAAPGCPTLPVAKAPDPSTRLV